MKIAITESVKIKLEIEFESLEDFFKEIMMLGSNIGRSKIYTRMFAILYIDRKDYLDEYEAYKKNYEVKNA